MQFPVLSLMDRWAEPPINMEGKNGEPRQESLAGALRPSYAPLRSHSHRSPSLSALNEVSSLSLGARSAALASRIAMNLTRLTLLIVLGLLFVLLLQLLAFWLLG